jgi:hypothetical protein
MDEIDAAEDHNEIADSFSTHTAKRDYELKGIV